jgi:uncharacterized protein
MSQGVLRRADKQMSSAEVEEVLARAKLAHFGTVGEDGEPYVVPNLFVYADRQIYLHTTSALGHFRRNVERSKRVCLEIAEMGQVFLYGTFDCDTSTSYTSVIAFGSIRIAEEPAEKSRFFDRLMAKYADPAWNRPRSFYPRLNDVTVYCIDPERVTGKKGPLPPIGEQWPARNRTRSPGAVPPAGR